MPYKSGPPRPIPGRTSGKSRVGPTLKLLNFKSPANPELTMTHRDGVPWFNAPLPRRWHRCSVWTSGWLSYFDKIDRCACGAIRRNNGPWAEKNSGRGRKR